MPVKGAEELQWAFLSETQQGWRDKATVPVRAQVTGTACISCLPHGCSIIQWNRSGLRQPPPLWSLLLVPVTLILHKMTRLKQPMVYNGKKILVPWVTITTDIRLEIILKLSHCIHRGYKLLMNLLLLISSKCSRYLDRLAPVSGYNCICVQACRLTQGSREEQSNRYSVLNMVTNIVHSRYPILVSYSIWIRHNIRSIHYTHHWINVTPWPQ